MSRTTITVDSKFVTIDDEKNLLEAIRKAGIDLPTFCYHSEISVYGACRMCMVEVEGRGILPACSTEPEDGMVIHTNTKQVRAMRKMIIELMLASHDETCTTCPKSGACRLQDIAKQLGIREIRFQKAEIDEHVDLSSPSIVRNPGKCILCGDCVRVCSEIMAVGALDFAYRGAKARVVTCNDKGIGDVECVNCGQCIKVCPVGALTIRTNLTDVWKDIYDKDKFVVVQIAPAVRVALGECFGEKPGVNNTGKIVSALKFMGVDRVYDMCYGADFVVVEEGKEFLRRYERGENLPIFTSCCPAWVKFAEQYYPGLLHNLSTAKSPMSMFSALCKEQLSKELKIPREKISIVCIAPCTAKKFEAVRPELAVNGNQDTDHVITTEELARMIKEHGIEFDKLEHSSLDMPLSFATGGAVIFGTTGGVAEAVVRYVASSTGNNLTRDIKKFRSSDGIKTGELEIGDKTIRLAVVSGLGNAKELIRRIARGEEEYDIVEVMACHGGCVNGGGQPIHRIDSDNSVRAQGLFTNDRMLQFHASNENPFLQRLYSESLGENKAHRLLHTKFLNRRIIAQDDFILSAAGEEKKLSLTICFGRSCFMRGAQELYSNIMKYVREADLDDYVEFTAKFCAERCGRGPILIVNGEVIEKCTYQNAIEAIELALIPDEVK